MFIEAKKIIKRSKREVTYKIITSLFIQNRLLFNNYNLTFIHLLLFLVIPKSKNVVQAL